jgi:hypothetical protein
LAASLLGGKTRFELNQVPWVVFHSAAILYLVVGESRGYPDQAIGSTGTLTPQIQSRRGRERPGGRGPFALVGRVGGRKVVEQLGACWVELLRSTMRRSFGCGSAALCY